MAAWECATGVSQYEVSVCIWTIHLGPLWRQERQRQIHPEHRARGEGDVSQDRADVCTWMRRLTVMMIMMVIMLMVIIMIIVIIMMMKKMMPKPIYALGWDSWCRRPSPPICLQCTTRAPQHQSTRAQATIPKDPGQGQGSKSQARVPWSSANANTSRHLQIKHMSTRMQF